MGRRKLAKISSAYLFNEAAYYYDLYLDSNNMIAYGRYCELRDLMMELNLSEDYLNYRFGKDSLDV